MPDPDRLLATLRRAADACRTTPGRHGHFVELHDADEVLVAGDLHGNLTNFRKVLTLAALDRHPRRHLVLQEVVHGPHRYPGGGDRSHQALDLVAALKCQFPRRCHFLLGNHELAQLTGRRVLKNDEDLNRLFLDGVLCAYPHHVEAVVVAYHDLLAAAPLALRTANRVFLSHSLPPPGLLAGWRLDVLRQDDFAPDEMQPGGPVHALLWGRDTSAANAAAFLARVDADLLVSGHVPCEGGFDVPNPQQLILDCIADPAACCLFPTDRPLTIQDLASLTRLL
jgi:hypothetical protein